MAAATSTDSIVGTLRNRDIRYGRNVHATVPLEQTLVSRSQERAPVEKAFVVDFDAFGKTGGRVTRNVQADQHSVHIHLAAVRPRSAAKPPAVGTSRIDRRRETGD